MIRGGTQVEGDVLQGPSAEVRAQGAGAEIRIDHRRDRIEDLDSVVAVVEGEEIPFAVKTKIGWREFGEAARFERGRAGLAFARNRADLKFFIRVVDDVPAEGLDKFDPGDRFRDHLRSEDVDPLEAAVGDVDLSAGADGDAFEEAGEVAAQPDVEEVFVRKSATGSAGAEFEGFSAGLDAPAEGTHEDAVARKYVNSLVGRVGGVDPSRCLVDSDAQIAYFQRSELSGAEPGDAGTTGGSAGLEFFVAVLDAPTPGTDEAAIGRELLNPRISSVSHVKGAGLNPAGAGFIDRDAGRMVEKALGFAGRERAD